MPGYAKSVEYAIMTDVSSYMGGRKMPSYLKGQEVRQRENR